MEQNYDFLKRMSVVHKPNRRDASAVKTEQEIALDASWKIVIPETASDLVKLAASDFQDYLLKSMDLSIVIETAATPAKAPKTLLFVTVEQYPAIQEKPAVSRAFALDVSEDGIVLCGADDRGVFAGSIHMEDLMNCREALFLSKGFKVRNPLTRMRSTHSGCQLDQFPDWQLQAIAHAGFTAIDMFVKGPNTTTSGYVNINDVIYRANRYGLDVVLYSYLQSYKHPDDADAEQFFDSVYGEIFRKHPGFAAIHLVGESLEFPSKDPHTTGKRHRESVVDGIPDTRPSPGWWPCYDYPAYVKRICDAVHKVKPEAEVILNTYNWGWTPAELRKEFLSKLPKCVTVHVTYDIFKMNVRNGLKSPVMDYSISADVPGEYFVSEVKAAKEAGIKTVRCTTNLAGSSWDFGTVPYAPVLFRWAKRMMILRDYLLNYNVNSFYDDHHYGWWPNPCNDLAKEIFSSDGDLDVEAVLTRAAIRDYGKEAAPMIVKAWKLWSDAMDHYVGSNEDQYGPWRVGPAYPFIFQPNITRTMGKKDIDFPSAPHAHFGGRIVKTLYQPYENENQSPGPLRYPAEIRDLEIMEDMWNEGLALVEQAQTLIPEKKKDDGKRLWCLGKFIRNSIRTTRSMKHWWLLNTKLIASYDRDEMLGILDKLVEIGKSEIANAQDTVEAVAFDSRLGWEPSMEYMCDPWHLDWKVRQINSMFREIETYRGCLMLGKPEK